MIKLFWTTAHNRNTKHATARGRARSREELTARQTLAAAISNHNQIENPPALPRDSRRLTVPGIVVRLAPEFASFPLTPTLSPRRGRALARRWKIRTLQLQSPGRCPSFRRHTITKLGRTAKAQGNVSPSLWGEGWGEGEQDTRSLVRVRFGLVARKPAEGPHDFEPFIISSLRLSGSR